MSADEKIGSPDVAAGTAAAIAGPGARPVPADKDVAIAIAGEERRTTDPAVTARARRKIDLLLIPTLTVGCTTIPRPRLTVTLADKDGRRARVL